MILIYTFECIIIIIILESHADGGSVTVFLYLNADYKYKCNVKKSHNIALLRITYIIYLIIINILYSIHV